MRHGGKEPRYEASKCVGQVKEQNIRCIGYPGGAITVIVACEPTTIGK